jgi:hypothetical protein
MGHDGKVYTMKPSRGALHDPPDNSPLSLVRADLQFSKRSEDPKSQVQVLRLASRGICLLDWQ